MEQNNSVLLKSERDNFGIPSPILYPSWSKLQNVSLPEWPNSLLAFLGYRRQTNSPKKGREIG